MSKHIIHAGRVEYTKLKRLSYNESTQVVVCTVKRNTDNKVFVMKTVPDSAENRYDGSREYNILMKIKNCGIDGVVTISHSYRVTGALHLLFDYQPDTCDLFDYISEKGTLPVVNALVILQNTVKTLLELRDIGVLHGDLKDENILIHKKTLKTSLIDFGSYIDSPDEGTMVTREEASGGTRVYMPPEYHEESNTSYDAHAGMVWSIGTLLFDMIYGDVPYAKVSEITNCNSEVVLGKLIADGPVEVDDETNDMIISCLRRNTDDRIHLDDIACHPCFQQINNAQ